MCRSRALCAAQLLLPHTRYTYNLLFSVREHITFSRPTRQVALADITAVSNNGRLYQVLRLDSRGASGD